MHVRDLKATSKLNTNTTNLKCIGRLYSSRPHTLLGPIRKCIHNFNWTISALAAGTGSASLSASGSQHNYVTILEDGLQVLGMPVRFEQNHRRNASGLVSPAVLMPEDLTFITHTHTHTTRIQGS
jgi:hypothetical protein